MSTAFKPFMTCTGPPHAHYTVRWRYSGLHWQRVAC